MSEVCAFHTFIYNFGFYSSIFVSLLIIWRIFLFFWRIRKQDVEWKGGPHTWAVVTGATDGIGLEFAKQLAEKKYNLLLLSRSIDKLNRVKNEIKEQHKNCEIRVLAVDFTSPDIYGRIGEELKKLEIIHVLVNNVGMNTSNGSPQYFTEIENLSQFIKDIVNVNVMAATQLNAMILPQMEKNGSGIVINVSSMAGAHITPLLSVYSATKAYIDFLSRGLNQEYKDRHKGITIQTLITGAVKTNMSRKMLDSFNIPLYKTPDQYVRSALKYLGKFERWPGEFVFGTINFIYNWFHILTMLIGFDFVSWINFQVIKPSVYKPQKVKNN